MKQELAEEKRAHAEIENYLKKHIEVKIKKNNNNNNVFFKDLDGKVEHWMSRYEEDLEMKTIEVQETKSAKAAGLQKLDELSQTVREIRKIFHTIISLSLPMQYKEREEVVIEHRAMKERQRIKEEQEKKENATATKVRDVMINCSTNLSLFLISCKHGGEG